MISKSMGLSFCQRIWTLLVKVYSKRRWRYDLFSQVNSGVRPKNIMFGRVEWVINVLYCIAGWYLVRKMQISKDNDSLTEWKFWLAAPSFKTDMLIYWNEESVWRCLSKNVSLIIQKMDPSCEIFRLHIILSHWNSTTL